ncbi:hypothetical protein [Afipia sp. Root123D2]|uniref:hypothetical protein n=1 Tax=Afipia sp. Root123D2 TaxID=1736436 RepID=UPI0012E8A0C9|nr:hypothetical protein [Afipia sp. Root123D2]
MRRDAAQSKFFCFARRQSHHPGKEADNISLYDGVDISFDGSVVDELPNGWVENPGAPGSLRRQNKLMSKIADEPPSKIVGCADELRLLAQAGPGLRLHEQKGQGGLPAFEHPLEMPQIDRSANRRKECLPCLVRHRVPRHRFLDQSRPGDQRRRRRPGPPEEIAIRKIMEAAHRRLVPIQEAIERARSVDKVVVGEIASGSSLT